MAWIAAVNFVDPLARRTLDELCLPTSVDLDLLERAANALFRKAGHFDLENLATACGATLWPDPTLPPELQACHQPDTARIVYRPTELVQLHNFAVCHEIAERLNHLHYPPLPHLAHHEVQRLGLMVALPRCVLESALHQFEQLTPEVLLPIVKFPVWAIVARLDFPSVQDLHDQAERLQHNRYGF